MGTQGVVDTPPRLGGVAINTAAFLEQRKSLFAFFDSLVDDWDRWAAAYQLLVEFFDGNFLVGEASEDFERLHTGPNREVQAERLEEFHETLNCLLGAACENSKLGQRQLTNLLHLLACKLRIKDDDLRSVASHVPVRRYLLEPGSEAASLSVQWEQRAKLEFHSLKTFIFDCDGVLWNVTDVKHTRTPEELQKDVLAKVNALLQQEDKRVLFLTNNSHETRWGYVQKLTKLGLNFGDLTDESGRKKAESSIITAGYTTAKYLKQNNVRKPFVLVSTPGLLQELEALGIKDYIATVNVEEGVAQPKEAYLNALDKTSVDQLMLEHENVDAVVVGWDFNLTALKIGVAVNCLKWSMEDAECTGSKAIPLITCSADSSGVLGTSSGRGSSPGRKIRAVGNGAMGQAIASCFDPVLDQVFCGKPSAALLQLLRDSEAEGGYGVELSSAVMIGDTIETDIAFANAGDMKSLFVLSGVNSLEDMEMESEPHRKSTWILPSFADS